MTSLRVSDRKDCHLRLDLNKTSNIYSSKLPIRKSSCWTDNVVDVILVNLFLIRVGTDIYYEEYLQFLIVNERARVQLIYLFTKISYELVSVRCINWSIC